MVDGGQPAGVRSAAPLALADCHQRHIAETAQVGGGLADVNPAVERRQHRRPRLSCQLKAVVLQVGVDHVELVLMVGGLLGDQPREVLSSRTGDDRPERAWNDR